MRIVEVGPRDGLQNETAPVPTTAKIAFVDALSDAGVDEIEVSAFVSPRWIPQLDDAERVFRGIRRNPSVMYSALVPNERGVECAISAGVDKIAIFTGASETFNKKNINTSIDGSFRRFQPVVQKAAAGHLPVRGYVSAAFWCAFEGKIPPPATIDVVERLLDIGVNEVSISDTIGKATPGDVQSLLDRLLQKVSSDRIAMHFHDTYGKGIDNVLASLPYGIRIFDASAGGLGGCPYAPGATGNVATEDVVQALKDAEEPVGVDLQKLSGARRLLNPYLVDDRRRQPEADSLACESCEFVREEGCCR